jgi:hypothetical protein
LVLLGDLIEETVLKISKGANFPLVRKVVRGFGILSLLVCSMHLLGQEEPMLASIHAVPPCPNSIHESCALLGVEVLGRTGSFPGRIGVKGWESEPICKLVLFEVGVGEDDK